MTVLRSAALAAIVLFAAPAQAFYCYIPEEAGGPVPLRERPDDGARIVAMMEPGGMVRAVANVERRGEWVRVRWQRVGPAARFDAVGWVRHRLIHGGECAD